MDVAARARQRLAALRDAAALRNAPAISDRAGVEYRLADQPVVGFCSNDYLGLAHIADEPRPTPPSGATGSRLISGDTEHHRDLEQRLAAFVGYPDAVLFPSGYQLNVGVLPCLLEPEDHVTSDRLNHASLIDGLRLSQARAHIVPHGQPPARPEPGRVSWWITESMFSMDGDRLHVPDTRAHLLAGGAMYLDDAHAFGLFPRGQGLAGHLALRPTVLVATLSKAVGVSGAFLAAEPEICHLVRNRARSYVFSTGMSPALLPRIGAALEVLADERGDELRVRLWNHARTFAAAIGQPEDPPSPIFPLVVGTNARALAIADDLLTRGWHVQAIRPPTVPEGTARLRVTLSAAHRRDHVEALADALREVFARHDVPLRIQRGST